MAAPRNMAMQSLGSFDSPRAVETYRRHSTMPGNDLAQVHRYLDLGASLDARDRRGVPQVGASL